MPNPYFQFKQFTVYHDRCAMKVTTDACLFGAWIADAICKEQPATGNAQWEKPTLLDIGAGTGLLSLMVAQKNNMLIEAVEIEAAAAEQAMENVAASPWKDAIRVFKEDVVNWQTEATFDVIFSNPPFYQKEIRSEEEAKNKAHHDESLTVGELFLFIKKHLKKEGRFYLLLPAKRKTEIEILLKKHGLFPEQIVYVQQTLKHQPFRLMIQGRHQPVETIKESNIVIKDNSDAYTQAFLDLLHPYYLYL